MPDEEDLPEVEDPDEDGPFYCGYEDTESGDPCGIRVSNPYETCGLHPNPIGGQPGNQAGGAPEGNTNAAGAGAPEGNTNAMKTGEYMSLKRKRDLLIEEYGEDVARQYFERLKEFREICITQARAHKLAILDVLADVQIDELIEERMETVRYTENGQPFEAFDDDRFNAAMSMIRETRMGLHYEGVSAVGSGDSPDQNADHDNLDLLESPDSSGD